MNPDDELDDEILDGEDDIEDLDAEIANGGDEAPGQAATAGSAAPHSEAGRYEGLDYPLCRDLDKENVKQWEAAMRAAAERNGGAVPMRIGAFYTDEGRLVALKDTGRNAAPSDTETLLNGLIEDCRFLIKEVVFHSARLTPDPNDRLRFLTSAETLAVTGAKVGRTIADLRLGQNAEKPAERKEENRYRMIIEHVQSVPALEPVNGDAIVLGRKGRGRGKGKTR